MNVNRSTSPRILILLMNYSPEDRGAQATRAIALHKEIRNHFPDTYLMMKEGDQPCNEENVFLLRPWSPSVVRFRSIRILKWILSRIWMTIEVVKFIHQKKITSVLLRGFDTVFLFPFCKMQKVKTFYDFHGRYNLELLQLNEEGLAALVKVCDKIILNLTDRILAVSEGILSQIPKHQHKCLLLQNGVDIDLIEEAKNRVPPIALPGSKYIVGFIGNWEQVLVMDDICNAVESVDNAISLIIGKGYDAERILSRYNNSVKHIFTGRMDQKDVFCLLHKMDVCMIPYDKGFYMSNIKHFFSNRKVFEYMAAGKPIIISNIEGKPKFLVEGTNCLTYESRNPKDLAEKITYLRNNPEIADRMSKNNRELARQFTWKNIIQKSGILDELAGKDTKNLI